MVAGVTVEATGGRHAPIYGEHTDCTNLGYLVDERLYHPLKTAVAIDFATAVGTTAGDGVRDLPRNQPGRYVVADLKRTRQDPVHTALAPESPVRTT